MNIAIIGATGFVGQQLVKEGLQRGHNITAIARDTSKLSVENSALIKKNIDVSDTKTLAVALSGQDVVISAFNPGWTNPNIFEDFLAGAKAIQQGVKDSDTKRLIVIGGAGSLFIAPGVQLVDTPEFPKEYLPGASAARDYYNILKSEQDLDWTFFSPAIEMHPGIDKGRTGVFRVGLDNPVFDENKRSVLSVEDLAVALIDEAEQPKHIRARFTAAY